MTDDISPTPSPEAEESQPQRRTGTLAIVIVVFLVLMILAVLSQWRTRSRMTARETDVLSSTMGGDLQLKFYYFLRSFHNIKDSDRSFNSALQFYRKAADASPSPRALRRLGALEGITNSSSALATVAKIDDPKAVKEYPKPDQEMVRQEKAMWVRLYSGERISPAEARHYIRLIREIDLGPARYIATQRICEAAGMLKEARAQQGIATSRYTAHVSIVMVLAMLLVLTGTAGLLGLLTLVVLLIVWKDSRKWLRLSDPYLQDTPLQTAFWWSFLLYMMIFMASSLIAGRFMSGAVEQMRMMERVSFAIQLQFVATIVIGVVSMLVMASLLRRKGGNLASAGLKLRGFLINAAWGIGAYVLTLPILGIAALIVWFFKLLFPRTSTPMNPVIPMLLNSSSTWLLIAVFVMASVLAPLFEETFFRGALFRGLRARYGVWGGIILSAAAFALVHPLPEAFLPIFVLGASFAMMLQARDSLVSSMVAHSIHNGLLFLFLVFGMRA